MAYGGLLSVTDCVLYVLCIVGIGGHFDVVPQVTVQVYKLLVEVTNGSYEKKMIMY
jgi:hypothetical protein